jgi:hypothetical protein
VVKNQSEETLRSNEAWNCQIHAVALIFQLYHGDQFYWWRKPNYSRENHRPAASHWKT